MLERERRGSTEGNSCCETTRTKAVGNLRTTVVFDHGQAFLIFAVRLGEWVRGMWLGGCFFS